MIRIGIIGTGGMANVHANRFNAMRGVKLAACADIDAERSAEFAEKHGIPAAYEDAEAMLKGENLDGVSIVTPDRAHAPCALLAIKHGVNVMCEKPLSDNVADAKKMVAAAKRKKVINCVNFSKRNSAVAQKAAQIVSSGKIGRVVHVDGNYRQGWMSALDFENAPHSALWRMSTKHGSNGVLGDLGVHLFDLASFVAGDFAQISCVLETFDKGIKKVGPYVFDANESAVATIRFKGGGLGTLFTSRWCNGHTNDMTLNVYGDEGAIEMTLDGQEPERLRYVKVPKKSDKRWSWDPKEWKEVKCPEPPSTYARFVTAIRTGKQPPNSFEVACKVQKYLEASAESSKKGIFIKM